ncbi:MAG TPA: VOC family protein [Chloroflexota bacterium]|nr:VOC family protein [Chloroflexota bacterium]
MSAVTMIIGRILETCLYVDDLTTAESFYLTVLGLELDSKVAGRHVFFRCGDSMFLLFNPRATSVPDGDVPAHGAIGPGHVAFAVAPAELPAWRRRLGDHGVRIEKEITWPSGGQSIYFRDPAGNSLELATPSIWGLPELPCGAEGE